MDYQKENYPRSARYFVKIIKKCGIQNILSWCIKYTKEINTENELYLNWLIIDLENTLERYNDRYKDGS